MEDMIFSLYRFSPILLGKCTSIVCPSSQLLSTRDTGTRPYMQAPMVWQLELRRVKSIKAAVSANAPSIESELEQGW